MRRDALTWCSPQGGLPEVGRGKIWRLSRPLPEPLPIQPVPDGGGHPKDNLPAAAHDLAGHVDKRAAKAPSVAFGRDHAAGHIFFEGLHQKEADQQEVVHGRVGLEALHGELLEAEVLERPVDELVGPAPVIEPDDRLALQVGLKGF